MHDTLREEVKKSRMDETAHSETLERFETVREATRHKPACSLTVIYEEGENSFDD